MDSFSLDFIGWFYTLVCSAAIAAGIAIFAFLHSRGQLTVRYKDYSIWNDVMLMVIWAIGLVGSLGVLDRSMWGQMLLQLFCWMLIALVCTSGATRLYTLKKLGRGLTQADWTHIIVGVLVLIIPIVVFCLATILSLKTDEARAAFGIH
jgi:hypothetical protein